VDRLADKLGQLAGLVFPFVSIGQWSFALGDAFPARQLSQLSVEFGHVLLVSGYVFFRVDRIHRTLGYANGAINALIWVDGEEVRAFAKAVHGADVDAIGVFTFDAGFCDGMGHGMS
jgi:hypothetical protein